MANAMHPGFTTSSNRARKGNTCTRRLNAASGSMCGASFIRDTSLNLISLWTSERYRSAPIISSSSTTSSHTYASRVLEIAPSTIVWVKW